MNTLAMSIDGMSCGHCVAAVRRALEGTPGVSVDEVTIGTATVHYDPDAAGPEVILAAVAQEGYQARVTGAADARS